MYGGAGVVPAVVPLVDQERAEPVGRAVPRILPLPQRPVTVAMPQRLAIPRLLQQDAALDAEEQQRQLQPPRVH